MPYGDARPEKCGDDYGNMPFLRGKNKKKYRQKKLKVPALLQLPAASVLPDSKMRAFVRPFAAAAFGGGKKEERTKLLFILISADFRPCF